MSQGTKVLVCDDETQILRALRVVLRDAGFLVLPASTAQEALDVAAVQLPEAAIIDLMLPDGDGVDVTRRLREWSRMPIIVLSALSEESEKVRALEAGADDYVTKPFGPRELVARLEAALRRVGSRSDDVVLRADDIEVDLSAHAVRVGGDEVHLTPKEYGLLVQLMRHQGRLMTHAGLLNEVWGSAYREDVGTLRTHMANLRGKVEKPGGKRHIRTESGIGYRFID